MNASCYLKGQNHMEKYEIARRLKQFIQKIRSTVLKDLQSDDLKEKSRFLEFHKTQATRHRDLDHR